MASQRNDELVRMLLSQRQCFGEGGTRHRRRRVKAHHCGIVRNFERIQSMNDCGSRPPSAGFNVTFEDLTLYTAAGAPLIFARLTAVRTGAYIALELLSRRVTWGRVTLTSILARRRVGRGSGEGAGGDFIRPHRAEIFDPPHLPPVVAWSEIGLDIGLREGWASLEVS